MNYHEARELCILGNAISVDLKTKRNSILISTPEGPLFISTPLNEQQKALLAGRRYPITPEQHKSLTAKNL